MKIESFKIIGISVRTTNEGGKSGEDIGEFWERFYKENIASKIPGKISEDIYSVYTDYESDYKGSYTTIIGCKVNSLNDIPEGMTGKEIEEGDYKVFTAKGKMPDAVINQWMEIWNDSDLKRAYTSDFEVYGEKSQNPENAEVDIYIAVK
jgi:predicted transcriptional regulator YdeE